MIILVCAGIFLAGVIKGITAFGFNLIAVSVLLFFLSPKLIVPIITMLSATSSLCMLVGLIKYVEIKRIIPLLIGGVIGVPLGVFWLVILKPEMLKVLMGIIITAFALLFASGFRKEIKNEKPAFALIGLISGILSGSTSLGGVPVILFFINQDCDKTAFRANITLLYTILGLASFLGYIKGDLITGEIIKYSLILVVPLALGILAGMRLVHRVNETLFRHIALMILIVSGLTSIWTGLRAIWQ